MNKPLLPIVGLYEKTSKNGDTFFTGKIGMSDVVVFRVKNKKSDKSPDWMMYVQEAYKRPEPTFQDGHQDFPTDDEIPF